MKKARILVVEDDRNVAEGLRDLFSTQGYEVFLAANGRETHAQLGRADLLVLDVSLGAENGYDLCHEVRQSSEIPVLFLTARDSEQELLRGFQVGGDDYLTKPFRAQELLARVGALLRRAALRETETLRSGALAVELSSCAVTRDCAALNLSAVEWKLASLLVRRYPAAVTREELLYQVWDKDAEFVDDNTLTVNISRLREKLGTWGGQSYVETVRGIGYRWAIPVGQGR